MPSISPEPGFHPLVEAPPLWRQLYGQIKDRIAPPPEPDLKLESTPIRVKDIWSRDERSLQSRLGSVGVHLAVIGILLLPFWRPVRRQIQQMQIMQSTILVPAPSRPAMKKLAGGGAPVHRPAPVLTAHVEAPAVQVPPPLMLTQTAAPNIPIPAFGSPGPVSGPPGTSSGNGGPGPGGPGSGNGGGDCTVGPCGDGGGITQPIPVYEPDPEYSDAARKAKFQGTVVVGVIIGVDGHVYSPRVVQPLGLGLDQKAIEAVRNWRFEPARRNGKAIQVAADIEVNFHLY